MSTQFNEELRAKTLKIIYEARDLHDVAMDLDKIKHFLSLNPIFEVMLRLKRLISNYVKNILLLMKC